MNEAETRAEHIDPALKAAGWGVVEGSRMRREYPITLGRLEGHGRRAKALTADYLLICRNTSLAVVEARITVQRAIVYAFEKDPKTVKGKRTVDLTERAIAALKSQCEISEDDMRVFHHLLRTKLARSRSGTRRPLALLLTSAAASSLSSCARCTTTRPCRHWKHATCATFWSPIVSTC